MIQEQELIRRAKRLIRRFDRMRIVGSGGEWSGNARQGFMFNPSPVSVSAAGIPAIVGACCKNGDCIVTTQIACESSGGTYQGDGTTCDDVDCCDATSGACCIGTDCSIENPCDCEDLGGTYQGDGTICDPNPCLQPTGACCIGSDCSIQTQEDCEIHGGVYQGDGTECDPNPCLLPDCPCGFEAFDGSGRRFLTLSATATVDEHYETPPNGPCLLTLSGSEVVTYNPITCDQICVFCSGSGHNTSPVGPGCDNDLVFTCDSNAFGTAGCTLETTLDCGNCAGSCDQVVETTYIRGIAPFSPLTVTGPTTAYRECSNEFGSQRVDLTLSDECIPV